MSVIVKVRGELLVYQIKKQRGEKDFEDLLALFWREGH